MLSPVSNRTFFPENLWFRLMASIKHTVNIGYILTRNTLGHKRIYFDLCIVESENAAFRLHPVMPNMKGCRRRSNQSRTWKH